MFRECQLFICYLYRVPRFTIRLSAHSQRWVTLARVRRVAREEMNEPENRPYFERKRCVVIERTVFQPQNFVTTENMA